MADPTAEVLLGSSPDGALVGADRLTMIAGDACEADPTLGPREAVLILREPSLPDCPAGTITYAETATCRFEVVLCTAGCESCAPGSGRPNTDYLTSCASCPENTAKAQPGPEACSACPGGESTAGETGAGACAPVACASLRAYALGTAAGDNDGSDSDPGYDLSGIQETSLAIESFAVSGVSCADGYEGTPVIAACAVEGGFASFAGCSAIICGVNMEWIIDPPASGCRCLAGAEPNPDGSASCVECGADTYKVGIGTSACIPCPEGSTTNGVVGAGSADLCLCLPGYPGASGGETCTACPIGRFNDDPVGTLWGDPYVYTAPVCTNTHTYSSFRFNPLSTRNPSCLNDDDDYVHLAEIDFQGTGGWMDLSGATCTNPNGEPALLCEGTAEEVPASCSGIADPFLEPSCTGNVTITRYTPVCDLDPLTDLEFGDSCPPGCSTPAAQQASCEWSIALPEETGFCEDVSRDTPLMCATAVTTDGQNPCTWVDPPPPPPSCSGVATEVTVTSPACDFDPATDPSLGTACPPDSVQQPDSGGFCVNSLCTGTAEPLAGYCPA